MTGEKEKQKPSPPQKPQTPKKEGFSVPGPNTNSPKSPFESPDPFTKSHKDFPIKKNRDDK